MQEYLRDVLFVLVFLRSTPTSPPWTGPTTPPPSGRHASPHHRQQGCYTVFLLDCKCLLFLMTIKFKTREGVWRLQINQSSLYVFFLRYERSWIFCLNFFLCMNDLLFPGHIGLAAGGVRSDAQVPRPRGVACRAAREDHSPATNQPCQITGRIGSTLATRQPCQITGKREQCESFLQFFQIF